MYCIVLSSADNAIMVYYFSNLLVNIFMTYSLISGTTGFLRVCRLVVGTTFHSTTLYFPSIPFRCNSCRNLEDQLQGAFGVNVWTESACKIY